MAEIRWSTTVSGRCPVCVGAAGQAGPDHGGRRCRALRWSCRSSSGDTVRPGQAGVAREHEDAARRAARRRAASIAQSPSAPGHGDAWPAAGGRARRAVPATPVRRRSSTHRRPRTRPPRSRRGDRPPRCRPRRPPARRGRRRRKAGRRTARENVADLVDDGSFVEYAPLVVAAQRRRRSLEELIERTPADGLVGGVGTVDRSARSIAMSYDYTVLAGTQGLWNHEKKDRLFELAERMRLPVVFFTEGGGGRPGDTDGIGVAGLDCLAFNFFARLSGLVPLVGITPGYCFAGNAALLGCCDVIIATEDSNIGMGGPAMIEGGGLGVYDPTDDRPDRRAGRERRRRRRSSPTRPRRCASRSSTCRTSSGAVDDWECADQRTLRHLDPREPRAQLRRARGDRRAVRHRLGARAAARTSAAGMITALARVEGRPLGIVANNPPHLGGAIDSDGADKAARFLQLCDAFDLPVLFLVRHARASWSGPSRRRPAPCATCSAHVRHRRQPHRAVRHDRPAQGLRARRAGDGRRQRSRRRCSASRGRPASSAAWASRARCGSASGASSTRSTIPTSASALFQEMVERMYEHGKARQHRAATSRSTT